MNRILLLLDNPNNRKLLAESLRTRYEVTSAEPARAALDVEFDIGILDGLALTMLWEAVQERKRQVEPLFLPFLLITSRQDVGMATRHLWQTIDEVITAPIEQVELQARIASLLRTRHMSKEIYRVALQEVSYAVAILDRDGTVLFWNRAAERLFGWSAADMLGRSLSTVQSDPPGRWEVLMNEAVSHGISIQRDVWLATKTHHRCVAEVSCTPLRVQGPETQISHLLLVASDVTWRRHSWDLQRRYFADLQALEQMTLALQQMQTVQETLRALLDPALAALGTTTGAVWQWQPDTRDLRIVAATDWLQTFADISIKPGEGVVGQTFVQGETLVVRELTPAAFGRSAVIGRVPAKWGGVCAPVRAMEGTTGVLFTAFPPQQRLQSDHITMLEVLVRIAGFKVQHLQAERRA